MTDDEDYNPMKMPEVKDKLFVLVGPTRAGKSTFINTLLGHQVAVEGKNESCHSTTKEISNYNNLKILHDAGVGEMLAGQDSIKFNFMDTVGFGDTAVTYTDEEI
jgi:septin family protein